MADSRESHATSRPRSFYFADGNLGLGASRPVRALSRGENASESTSDNMY